MEICFPDSRRTTYKQRCRGGKIQTSVKGKSFESWLAEGMDVDKQGINVETHRKHSRNIYYLKNKSDKSGLDTEALKCPVTELALSVIFTRSCWQDFPP